MSMPIHQSVSKRAFDPEDVECMSLAFEAVCDDLGLRVRAGRAAETVAKRVIALAGGERDAQVLCAAVLASFGLSR
jgi:hypothetical protein